jgi:mRNA-degrading endonuclease toxin of MazEF toxin-antitoxin module
LPLPAEAPHRRGHLYWATLDKRRPVLVVSPDYRNERASDMIVVPGSSVVREAPTHVMLRKGEGGVSARTVLKCEQILTLPTVDVGRKPLGPSLSARRVAEVERAILRAIGVPVPDFE